MTPRITADEPIRVRVRWTEMRDMDPRAFRQLIARRYRMTQDRRNARVARTYDPANLGLLQQRELRDEIQRLGVEAARRYERLADDYHLRMQHLVKERPQ